MKASAFKATQLNFYFYYIANESPFQVIGLSHKYYSPQMDRGELRKL